MNQKQTLRGRISVHGRGVGFLNPLDATAGQAAFIAPAALNGSLADDVVGATVTTAADGRSSASALA